MKRRLLNWIQQFDVFCLLDNHQYRIQPHSMECIAAAGVKRMITADAKILLTDLQSFIESKPSWLFGHLGYDLKNEIEGLSSVLPDHIQFPDFFFFQPEIIIRLNDTEMAIEGEAPEKIFDAINKITSEFSEDPGNLFKIENKISKEEYCSILNQLKRHIIRGDCYEINFCQEFFAANAVIKPIIIYDRLNQISPNPFSALYRVYDKWLICASPERFLKKSGNKILSQPIKGTSRRIPGDDLLDALSKEALYKSSKEKSENVMVVDLVRNDLSKICEEGTVGVEELFGVYTFPQVHQMISTVTGTLKKEISFIDIIKATFPMGSMTGAPKRNVMQLIEQFEKTKRGIFSGAVGYISPEGDFDFNVVIRSLMYNVKYKYLSFQTGSGITFYSEPEQEYEECILKAKAIKKILEDG
ncbi:MAG: anthranilate synthase component I family protein [Bacteroidetes bacterium]|nr:anthranilate synthase component I family protein [Bacteroidota bacterium]MBS1931389.1 anthranilate synthase component I family protein [Bacteroidota bacterium]